MFNPANSRDSAFAVQWRNVNPRKVAQLWEVHRTSDSWNRRCRDYVIDHLGDDIQFYSNGARILPSPDFQRVIDTAWRAIIPDIYDCITVLGVCPITFRRLSPGDQNTPFVPIVPHPMTYTLQVSYAAELEHLVYRVLRPRSIYADHERSLTNPAEDPFKGNSNRVVLGAATYYAACSGCTDDMDFVMGLGDDFETDSFISCMSSLFSADLPRGMVLDRNTVVLHGFGSDPTLMGELRTPLATLMDDREYVALHARVMAVNQIHQVTRPILLQKSQVTNDFYKAMQSGFAAQAMKTDGMGGGGDTGKHEMTAEEFKALADMLNQYHETWSGNKNAAGRKHGVCTVYNESGILGEALDDVNEQTRSIAVIPEDYTLPAGQRDESTLGQRYFDLRSQLDENISAIYGIPLPLLRQIGGNIRSMIDIMEQAFMRNVHSVASNISRVLDFSYQAIYYVEDRNMSIADALEPSVDPQLLRLIARDSLKEWEDSGFTTTARAAFSDNESSDDDQESEEEDSSDSDMTDDSDDEDEEKADRDVSDFPEEEAAYINPNLELKPEEAGDAEDKHKGKDKETETDDDRSTSSSPSTKMRKRGQTSKDHHKTNFQTDAQDNDGAKSTGSADKRDKKKQKKSNNIDAVDDSSAHANDGRVIVNLNISSRAPMTMISDAHDQGAVTDEEYWSMYRKYLDLPVNENTIEKLKKAQKEREESQSKKAGASSSSSRKRGRGTDSRAQLKGVGKGGNQANVTPQQPRSMRKGNEKRTMQAQGTQSTNASIGRTKGGTH